MWLRRGRLMLLSFVKKSKSNRQGQKEEGWGRSKKKREEVAFKAFEETNRSRMLTAEVSLTALTSKGKANSSVTLKCLSLFFLPWKLKNVFSLFLIFCPVAFYSSSSSWKSLLFFTVPVAWVTLTLKAHRKKRKGVYREEKMKLNLPTWRTQWNSLFILFTLPFHSNVL